MPLVNVMVNGRAYTLACDEGEEDHLRGLAGVVDEKVRELLGSVGQVGDSRLLLMASLLIADEHQEALRRLEEHTKSLDDLSAARGEMSERLSKSETIAAEALDSAAARAERIAARLAAA
jgi:cell division protein ZapA